MDPNYFRVYQRERARFRIKEAVSRLCGKCSKCGSTHNLHFHHTDPLTKKFDVSEGANRSKQIFYEEVDKCILLCAVCHADIHRVVHHGSISRYRKGCRCVECLAAWDNEKVYQRNYKRMRRARNTG